MVEDRGAKTGFYINAVSVTALELAGRLSLGGQIVYVRHKCRPNDGYESVCFELKQEIDSGFELVIIDISQPI